MTRPLTRTERTRENQTNWYADQERHAREERGEQGAMEFWLRITRSRIAKEKKAGREDVLPAFALLCRLFMTALDKRSSDPRTWNDLRQYAHQVVSSASGAPGASSRQEVRHGRRH